MHHRFRSQRTLAAVGALFACLSLGAAPGAIGADPPAPQPSAIERLVRQEDARAGELIRYDTVARQDDSMPSIVAPLGGDEFSWGDAALGLVAGVLGVGVLLGCLMLVRSRGRLRSV